MNVQNINITTLSVSEDTHFLNICFTYLFRVQCISEYPPTSSLSHIIFLSFFFHSGSCLFGLRQRCMCDMFISSVLFYFSFTRVRLITPVTFALAIFTSSNGMWPKHIIHIGMLDHHISVDVRNFRGTLAPNRLVSLFFFTRLLQIIFLLAMAQEYHRVCATRNQNKCY